MTSLGWKQCVSEFSSQEFVDTSRVDKDVQRMLENFQSSGRVQDEVSSAFPILRRQVETLWEFLYIPGPERSRFRTKYFSPQSSSNLSHLFYQVSSLLKYKEQVMRACGLLRHREELQEQVQMRLPPTPVKTKQGNTARSDSSQTVELDDALMTIIDSLHEMSLGCLEAVTAVKAAYVFGDAKNALLQDYCEKLVSDTAILLSISKGNRCTIEELSALASNGSATLSSGRAGAGTHGTEELSRVGSFRSDAEKPTSHRGNNHGGSLAGHSWEQDSARSMPLISPRASAESGAAGAVSPVPKLSLPQSVPHMKEELSMQRLRQIEQQLDAVCKENESMKCKLQLQHDQTTELTKRLEAEQDRSQRLADAANSAEESQREAIAERQGLVEQIRSLKSQLEEARNMSVDASRQRWQVQADAEMAFSDADSARQDLKSEQAKSSKLEKELFASQTACSKLEEDISELQSLLAAEEDKVLQAEARVKDRDKKVEALHARLEVSQSRVDALCKQCDEQDISIKQLQERLAGMTIRAQEGERLHRSLSRELESSNSLLMEKERQVAELRLQLEQQSDRMKVLQDGVLRHRLEVDGVRSLVDQLDLTRQDLQASRAEADALRQQLESRTKQLTTDVGDVQEQFRKKEIQLEGQIRRLTVDLDRATQRSSVAAGRLSELSANHEQSSKAREHLEVELEKEKRAREIAEQSAIQASEAATEISSQVSKLAEVVEQGKRESKSLRSKNRSLQTRLRVQEQKLMETEQSIQHSEMALISARSRHSHNSVSHSQQSSWTVSSGTNQSNESGSVRSPRAKAKAAMGDQIPISQTAEEQGKTQAAGYANLEQMLRDALGERDAAVQRQKDMATRLSLELSRLSQSSTRPNSSVDSDDIQRLKNLIDGSGQQKRLQSQAWPGIVSNEQDPNILNYAENDVDNGYLGSIGGTSSMDTFAGQALQSQTKAALPNDAATHAL